MAKKLTKSRPQPRARKSSAPRPAPRTKFPIFHVDAFTSRLFHGNPAAVVILDQPRWLPDQTMQAIAAENNLSETAFILRKSRSGPPAIRWFTPTVEVRLCGHATLASAHALWNHAGVKGSRIVFSSASGKLPVAKNGDLIVLDFPSLPGKRVPVTGAICEALGREPVEAYHAGKLMCVFENRREVYQLEPDFAAIARLGSDGVIVTAPGSGHDFVSRYFAPASGVNEDPVTGSSHCTLVPYWAHVLGKAALTAHQTSRRGGELHCQLRGKRVHIAGHAVTFSAGSLLV